MLLGSTLLSFLIVKVFEIVCIALILNCIFSYVLNLLAKRLCNAVIRANSSTSSEAFELANITVGLVSFNFLTDFLVSNGKLAVFHLRIEEVHVNLTLFMDSIESTPSASPFLKKFDGKSVMQHVSFCLSRWAMSLPRWSPIRMMLIFKESDQLSLSPLGYMIVNCCSRVTSLFGLTIENTKINTTFRNKEKWMSDRYLLTLHSCIEFLSLSLKRVSNSRTLRLALNFFSGCHSPLLRLGAGTAIIFDGMSTFEIEINLPKRYHPPTIESISNADYLFDLPSNDRERPMLIPSAVKLHLAPVKVIISENDVDMILSVSAMKNSKPSNAVQFKAKRTSHSSGLKNTSSNSPGILFRTLFFEMGLFELLHWVICDFRLESICVEFSSSSGGETKFVTKGEKEKSIYVELNNVQVLIKADETGYADSLMNMQISYAGLIVYTQTNISPWSTDILQCIPLRLGHFSGRVECLEKVSRGASSRRRMPVLSDPSILSSNPNIPFGTTGMCHFELKLLGRFAGPCVSLDWSSIDVLSWVSMRIMSYFVSISATEARGEKGGTFSDVRFLDPRTRFNSYTTYHDVNSSDSFDGTPSLLLKAQRSTDYFSDAEDEIGIIVPRVFVTVMLALDIENTEIGFRYGGTKEEMQESASLTLTVPDIKVQHPLCSAPVSIIISGVEACLDVSEHTEEHQSTGSDFSMVWMRMRKADINLSPTCEGPQSSLQDDFADEDFPINDGGMSANAVFMVDGLWLEWSPALACLAAHACSIIIGSILNPSGIFTPLKAIEWNGVPFNLSYNSKASRRLPSLDNTSRMEACFSNNIAYLWGLTSVQSCLSVVVTDILVEFPYSLGFDSGDMGFEDAIRWLQSYSNSAKRGALWSCQVVCAKEAKIGVTGSHPPDVNFAISNVEVSKAVYDTSKTGELFFQAQRVGFNEHGHVSSRHDSMSRKNYLSIGRFGVVQSSDCVDIFMKDVQGKWNPMVQVHLIKLARDVTLSVWMTMLVVRRSVLLAKHGSSCFEYHTKNPPNTSISALAFWAECWHGRRAWISGNKLHRLYAAEVDITGEWASNIQQIVLNNKSHGCTSVKAEIRLGVFSSESIGEQFSFEDVAFNILGKPFLTLKSLALRSVLYRDVLAYDDKGKVPPLVGLCFYEFRARALASSEGNIGAVHDIFGDDAMEAAKDSMGFLVETEGVVLMMQCRLPFAEWMEKMMLEIRALLGELSSIPGRWHPSIHGVNSDFHRLFWKPPLPVEQYKGGDNPQFGTHAWLRCRSKIEVHFLDDPFEAWLGKIAPTWQLALNERGLRTLYRYRIHGGDNNIRQEADAKIESSHYIAWAKKANIEMAGRAKFLLHLAIGSMNVDIKPPLSGHKQCWGALQELDECPVSEEFQNQFSMLVKSEMNMLLSGLEICVRTFPDPLFSCDKITANGSTLIALANAPLSLHAETIVPLLDTPPNRTVMFPVILKTLPPKLFMDMSVRIQNPKIVISPALGPALMDVANVALLLVPRMFGQDMTPTTLVGTSIGEGSMSLPWWDSLRGLLHGHADIKVFEAEVKISTAFSDLCPCSALLPPQIRYACLSGQTDSLNLGVIDDEPLNKTLGDAVIIQCVYAHITYRACKLETNVVGISALSYPPTEVPFPPLVEIPYLRANIITKWHCSGNANGHWVYFKNFVDKGGDAFEGYRSTGVSLMVSASLPNAKTYLRKGGSLPSGPTVPSSIVSKLDDLPRVMRVTFFGDCLMWLRRCMIGFLRIPPFPRHYMNHIISPSASSTISHIRVVAVNPVTLAGLDIALFDTSPTDINRRGLRLSLGESSTESAPCSGGALLRIMIRNEGETKNIPDPFTTGRAAIPSKGNRVYTVARLFLRVPPMMVRIYDHGSGSQGEYLLSVGEVILRQGKGEAMCCSMLSVVSEDRLHSEVMNLNEEPCSSTAPRLSEFGVSDVFLVDDQIAGALSDEEDEIGYSRGGTDGTATWQRGAPAPDIELLSMMREKTRRFSLQSPHSPQLAEELEELSKFEADQANDTYVNEYTIDDTEAGPVTVSESTPSTKENVEFFGKKGNSAWLRCKAGRAQRKLLDHMDNAGKQFRQHSSVFSSPSRSLRKQDPSINMATPTSASDDVVSDLTRATNDSLEALVFPSSASQRAGLSGDRVDGSSFLYRVVINRVRILLTAAQRDSLILLGLSAYKRVIVAIPELSKPPAALLSPLCDRHGSEYPSGPSPRLWGYRLSSMESDSGGSQCPTGLSEMGADVVSSQGKRMNGYTLGGTISGVLHKLFSIELEELQVQLHDDEISKSAIIFSFEHGAVQGWVGLEPGASQDLSDPTCCRRLQCLAQRLLTTFDETVTVTVQGVMISAAPTDVDVGAGVTWLPSSALDNGNNQGPRIASPTLSSARGSVTASSGSFFFGDCREENEPNNHSHLAGLLGGSFGLFKPIADRIDEIILQVLALHGAVESSEIDLSVPDVTVAADSAQLRMLIGALSTVVLAPLPQPVLDWREEMARRLRAARNVATARSAVMSLRTTSPKESYLHESVSTHSTSTAVQLEAVCGELSFVGWELSELKRTKEQVDVALEEVNRSQRVGRKDGIRVEMLKNWALELADAENSLGKRVAKAHDLMSLAVQERRKALAQRPNIEVHIAVQHITLKLQRDSSLTSFFVSHIVGIGIAFVRFDDASGSLDLEVRSIWADHFDEGTSSATFVIGEEGGSILARRILAPLTSKELEAAPAAMRQRTRPWTPQDPVVLMRAKLGTPVNGIPLVRHFEITLCPLVVRLRRSLFTDLQGFAQGASSSRTAAQARAEESRLSAFPFTKPVVVKSSSGESGSKNWSSNSRVSTGLPSINCDSDKKSIANETDDEDGSSIASANHQNGGSIDEENPEWSVAIKHLCLGEINVLFSYGGGGASSTGGSFEKIDNWHVRLHVLRYADKTWTRNSMLSRMKRDVLKDLVGQFSRNFSNIGGALAGLMKKRSHKSYFDEDEFMPSVQALQGLSMTQSMIATSISGSIPRSIPIEKSVTISVDNDDELSHSINTLLSETQAEPDEESVARDRRLLLGKPHHQQDKEKVKSISQMARNLAHQRPTLGVKRPKILKHRSPLLEAASALKSGAGSHPAQTP